MHIPYRQVQPKDKALLTEICFRTGHAGSDLSDKTIFRDRKLFGLLFCLYYPLFEADFCFVACDEKDRAVGYIIGTPDSARQAKVFGRRIYWRALVRILTVTWWRYPGSLRELMRWLCTHSEGDQSELFEKFPAHLHMNILPGHQGLGIGRRLMELFVARIREEKVSGIHLKTSNHNTGALGFYRKMGFGVIGDEPARFWSDIDDLREIVFAMEL